MSKVILSFQEAQLNKAKSLMTADFDTLIKEVAKNLHDNKQFLHEGLTVISLPRTKEYLVSTLQNTVLRKGAVSHDAILCALYIGDLMFRTISNIPESLYAIDYLAKGIEQKSGRTLCDGGDLCFLYCTVFKERAHWRLMSEKTFRSIGQCLYQAGYGKTGCNVHYQMGQRFEEMVEITKHALANL